MGVNRLFERDRNALLAFVGVWLAMIVAANPIGDFPINDDWVYAAAVRHLLDHGRFEIYGFSSANVGPLVYWGALFTKVFGFSFTALRASTLLLGLVGGIEVYVLCRLLWDSRGGAAFAALAVLTNPIWFALSNTFMTDVPFAVLMLGSVLAMVVGFQRDSKGLLVLGVVLATINLLMRQFGVVVLAGFAAGHVVRHGWRSKSVVIAITPIVFGLVVNAAFSSWLVSSGRKPVAAGAISSLMPVLGASTLWQVRLAIFNILNYVGFMACPLLLAAAWGVRSMPRSAWRTAVLVSIVGVAALIAYQYVAYQWRFPLADNIMNRFGIGPITNSDTFGHSRNLPRESAQTAALWVFLTLAAILGAAALVVACALGLGKSLEVLRRRQADGSVASFVLIATCAACYVAILVLLSIRSTLFDRYLLPLFTLAVLLVPVVTASAPYRPVSTTGGARVATVAIVLTALYSVVCTHDYLAFNRVRWAALQQLLAEGVTAQRVDGGYEFNGWYLYSPAYKARPGKSWWWVEDDEFQATSGPVDGYRLYRRYTVPRWWDNGSGDVQILRRIP